MFIWSELFWPFEKGDLFHLESCEKKTEAPLKKTMSCVYHKTLQDASLGPRHSFKYQGDLWLPLPPFQVATIKLRNNGLHNFNEPRSIFVFCISFSPRKILGNTRADCRPRSGWINDAVARAMLQAWFWNGFPSWILLQQFT